MKTRATATLIGLFFLGVLPNRNIWGGEMGNRVTEISLRRSAGLGPGGVYAVVLKKDGASSYHGESGDVPRQGTFAGRMDRAVFQRLADAIDELHFFDFKDKYLAEVTDASWGEISVVRDGVTKRIEFSGNQEPASLWALGAAIDGVSQKVSWKKESAGKPSK